MKNRLPLVSVGIPTYNRAKGLRRTLKCITVQTYKNLEIIVSDNCSPGPETEAIVREFMAKDSRIQYFRQEKNKGGTFNFKFVLEKATGEYFMWAADDDEWEDRFIEVCILKIGNYSSVMTDFKTLYRTKNLEKSHDLPDLSPQHSVYKNLRNHLLNLTPSLVYGLHKRTDILWVLKSDIFDWWDCFFISNLLVNGSGIMLIRNYIGYKAGIDTENYILKPINPHPNRVFQYYSFVRQHVLLIALCKKLSITEKLKLIDIVFRLGLKYFSHYEKNNRPILTNIAKIILKCRQLLVFVNKLILKVANLRCYVQKKLDKRKKLEFYSHFIKKGDLCFDVGANLGNRTDIFLKLGASVVAIEPQEICMQKLWQKFGKNNRVILVQKALGDKEGEGNFFLSNAQAISSMSKEWINSVKASGRFSAYQWQKTVKVSITTLEKVIEEYGKPTFCKIDVEGFEFQVLKGLSQPIKTISFEFTPEFIDSAVNSIKYLSTFGRFQFNYSVGESMCLSLLKWVESEEICKILLSLSDKTIFGDIYAKIT